MKQIVTAAILLSMTMGCDKTEEPAPTDESSAKEEAKTEEKEEPKASGPELSPEEPKTKLGSYPVPGDLEAEADEAIVIDNLEAELDRLEAEIDG